MRGLLALSFLEASPFCIFYFGKSNGNANLRVYNFQETHLISVFLKVKDPAKKRAVSFSGVSFGGNP